MTRFLKILKSISRALLYVSYGAILVLLGMTVWDVFMRYVFGRPNSGVTEVSQMLLIISMTCLAHALVEGRNVAVGVIVDRFPKVGNFAVEIIMGAVAIVFFFIVGWQLIVMTGTSMNLKEAYFVIKTPRWPMYLILGISFLACIVATFVYVMERIRNYKPPKEVDFFEENPDLAILALSGDDIEEKGGVQ